MPLMLLAQVMSTLNVISDDTEHHLIDYNGVEERIKVGEEAEGSSHTEHQLGERQLAVQDVMPQSYRLMPRFRNLVLVSLLKLLGVVVPKSSRCIACSFAQFIDQFLRSF